MMDWRIRNEQDFLRNSPWDEGLFDHYKPRPSIKETERGLGPLMDEDICFEEHMNEPNYWKTLLKTCPPATQKTSTF